MNAKMRFLWAPCSADAEPVSRTFFDVISKRFSELEGSSLWTVTFLFIWTFLIFVWIVNDKLFDLLKDLISLLKQVLGGLFDGCKGVFNGIVDGCKGVYGAFENAGINLKNGMVEVWNHSSVEKLAHLFSLGVILVLIPAIASAMHKVLSKDIPRWLEKG
mmetsp:Transcript_7246/g.8627  ORF Transcript_7246/g.8627 Transcript_7246/m.8627 type:complete len:160 (+) Transcript_7246:87-566(+)